MNLFNIPGTTIHLPVPGGWIATMNNATADIEVILSGPAPDTNEQRSYHGTVVITASNYLDRCCKVRVRRECWLASKWDSALRVYVDYAWKPRGYGGVRDTAYVLSLLLQGQYP